METPAAEVTVAAPATGALTAVVQVVSLNVRQGPGTTYAVAGKLPEGTEITVEGRNEAGDWWNICCVAGGDTRWLGQRDVGDTQFYRRTGGGAAGRGQ